MLKVKQSICRCTWTFRKIFFTFQLMPDLLRCPFRKKELSAFFTYISKYLKCTYIYIIRDICSKWQMVVHYLQIFAHFFSIMLLTQKTKPIKENHTKIPTLVFCYRTGPPGYIGWRNWFLGINSWAPETFTEPVLLNVYGAPELIPRNEFRQPM